MKTHIVVIWISAVPFHNISFLPSRKQATLNFLKEANSSTPIPSLADPTTAFSVKTTVVKLPIQQVTKLGHQMSTMLIECEFNNQPCQHRLLNFFFSLTNFDCGTLLRWMCISICSNFTISFNLLYGNCFTFNDGQIAPRHNVSRPGSQFGAFHESP